MLSRRNEDLLSYETRGRISPPKPWYVEVCTMPRIRPQDVTAFCKPSFDADTRHRSHVEYVQDRLVTHFVRVGGKKNSDTRLLFPNSLLYIPR